MVSFYYDKVKTCFQNSEYSGVKPTKKNAAVRIMDIGLWKFEFKSPYF